MDSKYRLVILGLARSDIANIEKYIAQYDENAAKNYMERLYNALKALASMPYIGQKSDIDPAFRRLVIDNYLAFYTVDDNAQLVEVHRILHGAMDIKKHIRQKR